MNRTLCNTLAARNTKKNIKKLPPNAIGQLNENGCLKIQNNITDDKCKTLPG